MDQPCVKVGIMSAPTIRFVFDTPYIFNGKEVTGAHEVAIDGGKVKWLGNTYDSLEFAPVNVDSDSFELIDVVIGVNFHWERKENQKFRGSLRLIVEGEKLTAINILSIEE